MTTFELRNELEQASAIVEALRAERAGVELAGDDPGRVKQIDEQIRYFEARRDSARENLRTALSREAEHV